MLGPCAPTHNGFNELQSTIAPSDGTPIRFAFWAEQHLPDLMGPVATGPNPHRTSKKAQGLGSMAEPSYVVAKVDLATKPLQQKMLLVSSIEPSSEDCAGAFLLNIGRRIPFRMGTTSVMLDVIEKPELSVDWCTKPAAAAFNRNLPYLM